MKKTVTIIISFILLNNIILANDTFSVTISGKYLLFRGRNFKEVYGDNSIFPELKLDVNVFKSFYLWAGYGFSSNEGKTIPELGESVQLKQHIISGGIGFRILASKGLNFLFEAGAVYFNNKEKAFNDEINSSAVGYRIVCGTNVNISNNFFTQLSGGYISADDKVEEESIKLGGLFASLGLGLRF